MFSPEFGDVFFKATVLPQQSGASEINIDILLAALDAFEVDPALSFFRVLISNQSRGYVFSINNSEWTPVSTNAAKALGSFDGMERVDYATLRKVLLAAK